MLRRCSTSAVAGSTRLSRHLSRASLASSRRNNRALLSLRGKATASDRWNSVDGGGIGLETAAAAAVSAAGVESEMQASLAAWSGAGGHRLRRGSGQRCMQQQGGGGMLWEKKEAGWHLQGASGDGRVGAAGLGHNHRIDRALAPTLPTEPSARTSPSPPVGSPWIGSGRGNTPNHNTNANTTNTSKRTAGSSRSGGGVGGSSGAGAGSGAAEPPGASSYVNQAIIRRLASARRSKNWRAALEHLDAIEAEAGGGGGGAWGVRGWRARGVSREHEGRARTTVYNMVMDVLAARRRWQEAFMLVETMQERGAVVDIITLNSVLKACGAAGRVELVMALLAEMRAPPPRGPAAAPPPIAAAAGAAATDDPSPRLDHGRKQHQKQSQSLAQSRSPSPLPAPDLISYNVALSACARAGQTSLALSLFDEMVTQGGGVAGGESGGGLGWARERGDGDSVFLGGGDSVNAVGGGSMNLRSGNSVNLRGGGSATGPNGSEASKEGVVDSVPKNSENYPNSTGHNSEKSTGGGYYKFYSEKSAYHDGADSPFSYSVKTDDRVSDDSVLPSFASSLLSYNSRVENAAGLAPAPAPNLASYNAVLTALGRCEGGVEEGLERAFEILETMRGGVGGAPSPDVATYQALVTLCGRAGHWDKALAWVDAALEEGLAPTTGLFREAIIACGKGGVWRRSLSVMHDMSAHRVFPDKFCCNATIRACADSGEVREALRVLDERLFGSNGANGFSYSPILDALARQGDANLALRLLREIEAGTGRTPNCWHYGSAFVAFLNAGDEPGALSILSEWRAIQFAEVKGRMATETRGERGRETGRERSTRGNSAAPSGEGGWRGKPGPGPGAGAGEHDFSGNFLRVPRGNSDLPAEGQEFPSNFLRGPAGCFSASSVDEGRDGRGVKGEPCRGLPAAGRAFSQVEISSGQGGVRSGRSRRSSENSAHFPGPRTDAEEMSVAAAAVEEEEPVDGNRLRRWLPQRQGQQQRQPEQEQEQGQEREREREQQQQLVGGGCGSSLGLDGGGASSWPPSSSSPSSSWSTPSWPSPAAAPPAPAAGAALEDTPATAPGERFQPQELVALAAAHADAGKWSESLDVLETAKEVSRAARAGIRTTANELLLGRGGEGAGGGSGLASWREVAARNSEATARSEEAARALRACFESAVEALGRAGRHEEALRVLKEGVSAASKNGLRLDPSCCVAALRACGDVEPVAYFNGTRHSPASLDSSLSSVSTRNGSEFSNEAVKRPPLSRDSVMPLFLSVAPQAAGREYWSTGGGDRASSDVVSAARSVHPTDQATRRAATPSARCSSRSPEQEQRWNEEEKLGSAGRGGGFEVRSTRAVERRCQGRHPGAADFGSASAGVDRDAGRGSGMAPSSTAAELLGRMEGEGGIAPNAWCVNVVMEAAIRDRSWSLASSLLDEAEHRFMRTGGSYHRGMTPTGASSTDRGPREIRTVAVDPMCPTALTYHLAIQACASELAENLAAEAGQTAAEDSYSTLNLHSQDGLRTAVVREGRRKDASNAGTAGGDGPGQTLGGAEELLPFATRALALVRKMTESGIGLPHETAALAQHVCAKTGSMGAAIEIRQLAEDAAGRTGDDFLGQWRLRKERKRTLARY